MVHSLDDVALVNLFSFSYCFINIFFDYQNFPKPRLNSEHSCLQKKAGNSGSQGGKTPSAETTAAKEGEVRQVTVTITGRQNGHQSDDNHEVDAADKRKKREFFSVSQYKEWLFCLLDR